MNMRSALINATLLTIGASKADRLLAPALAGPGVILTFHRVTAHAPRPAFCPNGFLAITPDFLTSVIALIQSSGLEIISMDEVLGRLRRPNGRRFVVLTFDDGYRDTLDIAADVLQRKSVPWTVYVVPAFLDGIGRLWWIELEECVRRLEAIEVVIDSRKMRWKSETFAEKAAAYAKLAAAFYSSPADKRFDLIDDLCLKAHLGTSALASKYFATWSELVEAGRNPDMTIGAHTQTHPVLSRCADAVSLREIAGSKTDIEKRLGRRVRHLAYPHGSSWAFGPREMEAARVAGFDTAVSTRMVHLHQAHAASPFALPRISMDGCRQSLATTRAILSGVTSLGAARWAKIISSRPKGPAAGMG